MAKKRENAELARKVKLADEILKLRHSIPDVPTATTPVEKIYTKLREKQRRRLERAVPATDQLRRNKSQFADHIERERARLVHGLSADELSSLLDEERHRKAVKRNEKRPQELRLPLKQSNETDTAKAPGVEATRSRGADSETISSSVPTPEGKRFTYRPNKYMYKLALAFMKEKGDPSYGWKGAISQIVELRHDEERDLVFGPVSEGADQEESVPVKSFQNAFTKIKKHVAARVPN